MKINVQKEVSRPREPLYLLRVALPFCQKEEEAERRFCESMTSQEADTDAEKAMDIAFKCSRGDSRVLSQYMEDYIYPKLEGGLAMSLPPNCPFHPEYNIFRTQERHKISLKHGEWECEFCGKKFKSQKYIDRHMHNKHVIKLDHNLQHDTGCIADLCPLLGCSMERARARISEKGTFGRGSGAACTTANLERSKFRCEGLMRRCFTGSVLHHFRTDICESFQCTSGVLTSSVDRHLASIVGNDDGDGSLTRSTGPGTSSMALFVLGWVAVAVVAFLALFIACGTERKKPLMKGRAKGVSARISKTSQAGDGTWQPSNAPVSSSMTSPFFRGKAGQAY